MKRSYRPQEIGNAAKIIGVDVARFGDDESALAFRQGIQAFPFMTLSQSRFNPRGGARGMGYQRG
jgi:hypothetical protein